MAVIDRLHRAAGYRNPERRPTGHGLDGCCRGRLLVRGLGERAQTHNDASSQQQLSFQSISFLGAGNLPYRVPSNFLTALVFLLFRSPSRRLFCAQEMLVPETSGIRPLNRFSSDCGSGLKSELPLLRYTFGRVKDDTCRF